MSLGKQEFIRRMAEKSNSTISQSEKSLNAALAVISDAMVDGEDVQFVGFGTFKVSDTKERQGQNPNNPEQKILIPAGKRVSFKPGKGLKDAVKAVK